MNLAAIRRYRAQLEDVVRLELLQARQTLQDAELACQALDAQMQGTAERYGAKARAGMAPDEFVEWQATCDAEAAMLIQAQQREGRLREQWSQKQLELRAAMQARRTLDRLAARERLQQLAVQHRHEQTQMDEAARRTSARSGVQDCI